MDMPKPESREGIRSVKAAVGIYGGRSQRRKPDADKTHIPITEELRVAKDEVRRLKLDMALASETKTKAEKEAEYFAAKTRSYETSAEEVLKQIDTSDEDHVLVELARIEAVKELKEIQLQRETEAINFSNFIEIAKKKITDLRKEVNHAKELEIKLAATNSEISYTQNEMKLVRSGTSEQRSERVRQESSSLLRSARAELDEAKKELKSVKEEGFQYMFSMDLVRKELMHISLETDRLKKIETNAESAVKKLSSKLLKAQSKLESVMDSEERAKGIVSNLASALERMQAEVEAAKRDKEDSSKQVEAFQIEKEKAGLDIKEAEEGLQSGMQDLKNVKQTEELALKKLQIVRERIIRSRTSTSPNDSTITISKYEYDYMRKRAAAAKQVADKKVAAAQAWIESLKAGEKEILMKSESTVRETEEIRIAVEDEHMKSDENVDPSKMQLVVASPRKSLRDNLTSTTARRVKIRRLSASPGAMYNPHSPSLTVKKRVMRKSSHVTPPLQKLVRT